MSNRVLRTQGGVMEENKRKEGISVKEIETFAKKNRFQVAIGLAIVLACLFSFFLSMMGLSVLAVSIGAMLGIFLPNQVENIAKKAIHFVAKQEQTTQLVLAAVLLIISIFLPPFIFLLLGLHGGKDVKKMTSEGGSHTA